MQEQLKPETQAKLRKLLQVRNVIGFQKKTVPRINDDGTTVDEEVIQVIVSEKMPVAHLRDDDIIPTEIDGIPINVVDNKGHPKIFDSSPAGYYCTKCGHQHKRGQIWEDHLVYAAVSTQDANPHRNKHSPLLSGISIGNYKITAGSEGWFYENSVMFPNDEWLIGSNAHVLTDHPNWDIPVEKRIVQPGKLDGGTLNDLIGEYLWHMKIYPEVKYIELSWWQKILKMFNLFKPEPDQNYEPVMNKIDFAVARPYRDIDYTLNTLDFNPIDLDYKLGSHLFAGGGLFTIGCKMKYIEELGFKPLGVETTEFEFGNQGRKSGRTTGDIQRYCAGDSAVMKVSYGDFIGVYDDVVLFNDMSDGGDSGSAIWKV